MTAPVADPSFYADFGELAALKRGAQTLDPQVLREAARQFESLFTRMLLSSMRAASFGDSLTGSDQQQFYQGMFDDQLAVELTKGRGLGLADLLVEQLTRAGLAGVSETDSAPSAASTVNTRPATGADETAALGDAAALTTGQQAGATDSSRMHTWLNTSPNLHLPASTPQSAANSTDGPGGLHWRPTTRDQFVRDLWPHAQTAARELGVDPDTLIAHAALETGWGQSMPTDSRGRSSFNLFGIKATGGWAGAAAPVRTLEFENAVPVSRTEPFRAYDSPASSFRDYVALLRDNPRYEGARGTGANTQAFAQALQEAGYATDPDYARKLTATAQTVRQLDATRAFKTAAQPPLTSSTTPL